jgi:hypothetical protein
MMASDKLFIFEIPPVEGSTFHQFSVLACGTYIEILRTLDGGATWKWMLATKMGTSTGLSFLDSSD